MNCKKCEKKVYCCKLCKEHYQKDIRNIKEYENLAKNDLIKEKLEQNALKRAFISKQIGNLYSEFAKLEDAHIRLIQSQKIIITK